MSAIQDMRQLKDAGFTDAELGDWALRRHHELSDAGFRQDEIDRYFGHPPFNRKPLEEYITTNLQAATTPSGEAGQPKPVTSFTEAVEAGLQISTTGLLARGQMPNKMVPANAPLTSRVGSQLGTLAGDMPAMIAGFLAGGANPVTGTAGAFALPAGLRSILMDKYEKGEVENFSDFWDRLSGAMIETAKGWVTGAATGGVGKVVGAAPIVSPTAKALTKTSAEIATMVTVGQALEGHIPNANDFLEAALALGFVKGSAKMAGKLRQIYAETGVTPAQLAEDAKTDVTIMQDLASNKDIPRRYEEEMQAAFLQQRELQVATKQAETEGTTAATRITDLKGSSGQPPTPPKPPTKAADATGSPEEQIRAHLSIGHDETTPMTWQRLYTLTIDDLNPLKEVTKAAKKDIGELVTADDPYYLARLSRGTFGKADHFLEHSPFSFKTYENVGRSLKDIMEPVKDDIDGLRVYITAKRAIELADRGIETGIDPQVAHAAIKGKAAKYEPIQKALVEYQKHLVTYLRDAGVISETTFDAMLEANKEYVPFFRLMEEGSETTGRGGTSQPIKRIKGSERIIIDPLESVIKNTYAYISIAEQNAVGAKLLEMANRTGHPEDFIVPVKEKVRPIPLRETEIRRAFDEFLTFTKRTTKEKQETSTTTGGQPEAEPSKALKMVTDRVKEALRARGFSEGEASQMLARVAAGGKEGKGGTASTVEKLVKEIEKTEYIPELDIRLPNEAAVIFRAMQAPLKKNEIAIFQNGQRKVYQVDVDLAAALKASDQETANLLMKILAVPAKTLRAGAVLSPDFMARNFARDQLSAFILTKGGYLPVFDFVKGALSLVKQDAAFGNWLKAGGANAALVSMDRQYLTQRIFHLTEETGLASRAWNVIRSPLEMLRIASEFVENSTRIGEFKKALGDRIDKGAMQEAAMSSREVTLDFARIGAKSRALNMIAAFFNAQVQGVDRLARAMKEDPLNTSARIGAAVTLPSILLWWANHDDPRYKDIPRWQKDLFWIVMTEDHIYRIPKPFEVGLIFGTLPERVLDQYFTDNPGAFKDFENALMQAFLPNVMPNIAAPIVEQFANRSLFTGTPLVPSYAEKLLPEYQYQAYTTETAKALGHLFGAFPGMTERAISDHDSLLGGTARALSTPALVENYVRAWTGGLGMYALQIADAGLQAAGVMPDPVRPERTLADIPVVKAFMVRYPSASAQSIQDFTDRFFAKDRVYQTFIAKAKEGDAEAMERAKKLDPSALANLRDLQRTISEHNKLVRMVWNNADMTASDKRQLIDELYFNMIELAHAGNDMLDELEKTVNAE